MHFFYLAMLLVQIVGPLLMMGLRLLGIGVMTYTGINIVMDQVKNYVLSNVANVPIYVQQILGLAKFDICVNIVLSAVAARFVIAGYNKLSGSRKKLTTFTA